MTTKAESDAELSANRHTIEYAQAMNRATTGLYTRVSTVPNTASLSVHEFKGGGPKIPYAPDRNPGYKIVQRAEEGGKNFYRLTNTGPNGDSTNWIEEKEVAFDDE